VGDGHYFAYGILAVFVLIAIVSSIVVHEERQKRRKPNIRVPRETLWARTNKYYGDTH